MTCHQWEEAVWAQDVAHPLGGWPGLGQSGVPAACLAPSTTEAGGPGPEVLSPNRPRGSAGAARPGNLRLTTQRYGFVNRCRPPRLLVQRSLCHSISLGICLVLLSAPSVPKGFVPRHSADRCLCRTLHVFDDAFHPSHQDNHDTPVDVCAPMSASHPYPQGVPPKRNDVNRRFGGAWVWLTASWGATSE